MEFEFEEDAAIDLRDWSHLKHQYIYSLIVHLYCKQESDNFKLYRSLEQRQLDLGMVDIRTINPNPTLDIDLAPDEGYEF